MAATYTYAVRYEAEARRTDLFGLCFPTARPCGLEWTRSPVVKERQG